jgi:hypothetical protein
MDAAVEAELITALIVAIAPFVLMVAFFCGARDVCRRGYTESLEQMDPDERRDALMKWDVSYDLTRIPQFPWACLSVVVTAMWWTGRQPLLTAVCSVGGLIPLCVAFAVNRRNLSAASIPVPSPPVAVEVVVERTADESPAAVVEALPLVVPSN